MRKTLFAGLTELDAEDAFSTDGFSFQSENPSIIDQYLERGAVTHRHNAAVPIADPTVEPTVEAFADGGTIPADSTVFVGYTYSDDGGGETTLSPAAVVTTREPLLEPTDAPVAQVDYSAGSLRADTYYYAITFSDGAGGETTVGPAVSAEREPGFANGQVTLTGMADMAADAGAPAWRLYRAAGGGQLVFVTEDTADTFVDDGTHQLECNTYPPERNLTNAANHIEIDVPPNPEATAFSVYMSEAGDFVNPCLVGTFPIAELADHRVFGALDVDEGAPPDVATTVRGASMIDPDTELIDWHWKRPVADVTQLGAGDSGDVRLVRSAGLIYGVRGASAAVSTDWSAIGGQDLFVQIQGGPQVLTNDLEFVAGANATIAVVDGPGGKTIVTIGASGGGGGGTGATGATGPAGPAGPPGIGVWRGAWLNTLGYNAHDLVSYQGSTWVAKIATVTGAPAPPDSPSQWDLVASRGSVGPTGAEGVVGPEGPVGPPGVGVWRGDWLSSASYEIHDLVSYEGSTWLAIDESSGGPGPSDKPTAWELVAAQGDQGPAGNPTNMRAFEEGGGGYAAGKGLNFIGGTGIDVQVRVGTTDPNVADVTIINLGGVGGGGGGGGVGGPGVPGGLTAWQPLTLGAGWTDTDAATYGAASCAKDVVTGLVYVRAVLNRASGANNVIATLPDEIVWAGTPPAAVVMSESFAPLIVHSFVNEQDVGLEVKPDGTLVAVRLDDAITRVTITMLAYQAKEVTGAGSSGASIKANMQSAGTGGASALSFTPTYDPFAMVTAAGATIAEPGRYLITANVNLAAAGRAWITRNGAQLLDTSGGAGPTNLSVALELSSGDVIGLTGNVGTFGASVSVSKLEAPKGPAGPGGAAGPAGATGPQGPPGPFPSRVTTAVPAGTLAAGASVALLPTLAPSLDLLRVQTSRAARVRIYASAAYRDADAARAVDVAPTGNHGLLYELVTSASTLDFAPAPQAGVYTLETLGKVAMSVQNVSATAGDTTVTLTYLPSEA